MNRTLARRICSCTVAATLLFLTGCELSLLDAFDGRAEFTSGDTRMVTRVFNGIKRSMKYRGEVCFEGDRIVKMPAGCVIQIVETKNKKATVAEIREKNGDPELWMQAGADFIPANASQQSWLQDFLKNIQELPSAPPLPVFGFHPALQGQPPCNSPCPAPSTPAEASESEIQRRIKDARNPYPLQPLGLVAAENDKTSILRRVILSASLTPAQQTAIIEACFEHISYNADRTALLIDLIQRPDFCNSARTTLLGKIRQLAFESDRTKVLEALNQK